MSTSPLVSIIIPTYNRKNMLHRLIKSIFAGSYKNVEIIIIDDASTDGTSELIKEKFKENKKIKILKNKYNLQTAASKNKGIKNANGDFFFFVDDDNVLSKSLIQELVRAISSDEKIGEVGPVIYYFEKQNKIIWSQTKRNMFTTKTNTSAILDKNKNLWDTDDIPNTYMIRSRIMKQEKVKFNSKLGIMYEESDLAYKIRKLGYSIKVAKKAKIFHDIPLPTDDAIIFRHMIADKKRLYYIARNRLIFHTHYSSKIQLIGILIIWNWLFAAFYLYNILSYSGSETYSFFNKLQLIYMYLFGIFDGYKYALTKRKII